MSLELVSLAIAIAPFALGMALTPGPNNIMLASSGAAFGLARSAPVGSGVVIGFPLLFVAVGLCAGAILRALPVVFTAAKTLGVLYILWLAWKVARTSEVKQKAAPARPLSFLQGAAFQWVNPKAWMISLSAAATYVSPRLDLKAQVLVIAGVLVATTAISCTVWAVFGERIGRLLKTPGQRRAFSWTMAALLVASIVPVALER